MKKNKIIALLLLAGIMFLFQACSGTKVDYETGEPTNRPHGVSSDERVDIAINNRNVENIKNADIIVIPTEEEVYVMDPNSNKYAITLSNPHPSISQYVKVWDSDGQDIWEGHVRARLIKHVFTFRPSDEVYKIYAQWTFNGIKQDVTEKEFPKGTAKAEDPLGNPIHVNFNGCGKPNYDEKIPYQYQDELNSSFYHRFESNPDPKN